MLNFASTTQISAGTKHISAAEWLSQSPQDQIFQLVIEEALQTLNLVNTLNLAAIPKDQQTSLREEATEVYTIIFEGLTYYYLASIWIDNKSSEEVQEQILQDYEPAIIVLIAKAADTIENRCSCIYGTHSKDSAGHKRLLSELAAFTEETIIPTLMEINE